jgi:uncharacterized C2H2 Zn-finger protein
MSTEEYRKLTRDELRAFSHETTKIVLRLMAEGWTGRRSGSAHLRLLPPTGTDILSASTNANSAVYLQQEVDKWKKANGPSTPPPPRPSTAAQKWPCPRPGCPKTYMSEEQLNDHTHLDHEKMLKCPECGEWFKRANTLGVHRAAKHGYQSPTYKQRKKAELKRNTRNADKLAIESIALKVENERKSVNSTGTPVVDIIGQPNHVMTKGQERMSVYLGTTGHVLFGSVSLGARSFFESDGWTFEKIRPPAIEVFRALKLGTIVAVCFEFKDKSEMWQIIARGDGDTYVDMTTISQRQMPIDGRDDWQYVVMIHELGTELY